VATLILPSSRFDPARRVPLWLAEMPGVWRPPSDVLSRGKNRPAASRYVPEPLFRLRD